MKEQVNSLCSNFASIENGTHQHQLPAIEKEGILFESGKFTTIRVRRSRMKRVNTKEEPCNGTFDYTKDQCLKKCVTEKCVSLHKDCDLFSPWNEIQAEDWKRKLTGFDMDFCFIAKLYSLGVDPLDMLLFEVSHLEQRIRVLQCWVSFIILDSIYKGSFFEFSMPWQSVKQSECQ